MNVPYISKDLLHIILDYDGRIKYIKGKYITIIHKNDIRYDIILPIIGKKIEIMKDVRISADNSNFYFEFGFGIDKKIGLCYYYNFNFESFGFVICYYNIRNSKLELIKTYF
jgi:hypothetical protein